jgi:hypothetical protein
MITISLFPNTNDHGRSSDFLLSRLPSHSCIIGTVAGYAWKKTEITAAGTVQVSHLVPYYPAPMILEQEP